MLSKEISKAARVLGDVASLANLSPRLTGELRASTVRLPPPVRTEASLAIDRL
jgi:hypothetical protein